MPRGVRLSQLHDTAINQPQEGQVLLWGDGGWVNGSLSDDVQTATGSGSIRAAIATVATSVATVTIPKAGTYLLLGSVELEVLTATQAADPSEAAYAVFVVGEEELSPRVHFAGSSKTRITVPLWHISSLPADSVVELVVNDVSQLTVAYIGDFCRLAALRMGV